MRVLPCIALLLIAVPCAAWDTAPHQKITREALATLPKNVLDRFGSESTALVEIYCTLPDRYVAMERFGFVMKDSGPRSAAEIRRFCVRPDGEPVHSPTGNRDTDLGSLVFLFERIVTSFSENHMDEAAKYSGVLAHFVEDGLSPPHAVSKEELDAIAPSGFNVHSFIEKSVPEFSLGGRAPRKVGDHIVSAAQAILESVYSAMEQNRKDLVSMVRAACARDQRTLDTYRLRSGRRAAEILADALFTLSELCEQAETNAALPRVEKALAGRNEP